MVLKLVSIKTMVIALARTGIDRTRRVEVIIMDQQNKFSWAIFESLGFRKIMEMMKFIDLSTEDIPLMCSERIVKFIEILFCEIKGGYRVHPVLMLLKINIFLIIKASDGTRSQNLRLFIRGNIKSIELIISGISQLLILPMMIGMVIKKIIINAWIVIVE